MMETGDGLATKMNFRTIRFPHVYSWSRLPKPSKKVDEFANLRKLHRLDSKFQDEDDFRALEIRERLISR
jgi:hypothetical protein